MRKIERSTAFKKDYKRAKKSGQHNEALRTTLAAILGSLATDRGLDPKYRDHALFGDWDGYRECHVKPDLLLIYKTCTTSDASPVDVLRLARLGSHSELFG